MSNSVAAALAYIKILDKLYKKGALSSILDVNPAWVREADMAGAFYIPKLTLVGLGDYSTSTGFAVGDVTLEWVVYTYSQDRSRQFNIDKVENDEGAAVAFGNIAAEFERLHVAPEIDAYRFAAIATGAGTDVAATLTAGADAAAAVNLALTTLREADVPDDNMALFITPTFLALIKAQVALTGVPCEALDVATVVAVPQTRFYTAITLSAGGTSSVGGYTRATGAEGINFILMDKGAAFADAKHQALRIFSPNGEGGYPINQDTDGWEYQFRIVHDCWPYANKLNGIYVHTQAATAS